MYVYLCLYTCVYNSKVFIYALYDIVNLSGLCNSILYVSIGVAILDSTNPTHARRVKLLNKVRLRSELGVV